MKNYIASSENFDKHFKTLLKRKNKKRVIKSQFNFEYIGIDKKIKLIKFLITNRNTIKNIIYKIIFWEKDKVIENCLVLKNYEKVKSYKTALDLVLYL